MDINHADDADDTGYGNRVGAPRSIVRYRFGHENILLWRRLNAPKPVLFPSPDPIRFGPTATFWQEAMPQIVRSSDDRPMHKLIFTFAA
ncbi:hypothetical protein IL54_0532 [Sphingobium sp. ba1]|jgi:hypothetical protein|nr:hypothetical protein IL54_0532 [Sphingobium sp. ba1]